MKYERVNFSDEAVRKMSEDEFVARHINIFWTDRAADVRKKMLGEVYSLIVKPAKKTKKKSGK